MLILDADEQAAIQAPVVSLVVLVEMDLSSTVRFCSGGINLEVDGLVYYGTAGLGAVDAIDQSPGDFKSLSFSISGALTSAISMALGETVMRRGVRVYQVLMHPTTGRPLRRRLKWQGLGDVMHVRRQGDTSAIVVTAQPAAADLLRAVPSYWSDAEQRRLFSNDPSLQYMAAQVEQRITWPARSYYQR